MANGKRVLHATMHAAGDIFVRGQTTAATTANRLLGDAPNN